MSDRHRRLLDRVVTAVTTGKGELPRDVRQNLVRGKGMAGALGAFAIKVACNPTSITEENVEALRASGHSDDAIFECVIAAAFGAGLERLEAGLKAAGIGRDAPP